MGTGTAVCTTTQGVQVGCGEATTGTPLTGCVGVSGRVVGVGDISVRMLPASAVAVSRIGAGTVSVLSAVPGSVALGTAVIVGRSGWLAVSGASAEM